jgi:SAM-dependent methyltransferase
MVEVVENIFRWSSCPLCKSQKIHFIGQLKYNNPVLFSSYQIDITEKPELWKCNSCYSWYANNILPENIASNLYKRGVSSDRWLHVPIEQGKPKEIVMILSDIFTEGKNVLDIGCNTGEVLDFARKRGCITSGVEFSMGCHYQLKEKGHICFPDLEEANSTYDVIIAFDIVEHMYDLPFFLNECKNKLANDGTLIILTGDINSLCARLCKSKWWYVNFPEHIVFPSKEFYQNISGFQVNSLIKTYASLRYKQPLLPSIKSSLTDILKGKYTGLPSIGPDHVLICLNKFI